MSKWLSLLFLMVGVALSQDTTTQEDTTTTIPGLNTTSISNTASDTSTTLSADVPRPTRNANYTLELENCCLMPSIIPTYGQFKCVQKYQLNPFDTVALSNHECYLKCMADANRLVVNGTIDREELFESIIHDLATELVVVWTRVLNLAVYTCTDEDMVPTLPSTTTDDCASNIPFTFGCIYSVMSENCPLYAINTTKPECVKLRYDALNVTQAPTK